jgi:DtxR family Mn-dependent transcriptional regulator
VTDPSGAVETYLRLIYDLDERGIVARRARIAERLGRSLPAVSETVARMQRGGLVRLTGRSATS